jgi:hypothetical protein
LTTLWQIFFGSTNHSLVILHKCWVLLIKKNTHFVSFTILVEKSKIQKFPALIIDGPNSNIIKFESSLPHIITFFQQFSQLNLKANEALVNEVFYPVFELPTLLSHNSFIIEQAIQRKLKTNQPPHL